MLKKYSRGMVAIIILYIPPFCTYIQTKVGSSGGNIMQLVVKRREGVGFKETY